MSNDSSNLSLRGTKGAQQNKISHRDRVHPWHLPYMKTCIISDCRTKPYYDGSTYFTCCLSCLQEKELGPFYKNKNPRLFSEAEQTPTLPKIATTEIEPTIDDDGVVTSTINSDDL